MLLVRFGETNQNLAYFDQSVAYVGLEVIPEPLSLLNNA
jgi:hypothetical protein